MALPNKLDNGVVVWGSTTQLGQMTATPPSKLCPRCGETKPATVEFFHRSSSRPGGLRVYCKACRRQDNKTSSRHSREKPAPNGEVMKECVSCGDWFPRSESYFYLWGGRFTPRCRRCEAEKRGIKRPYFDIRNRTEGGVETRLCTACDTWQPANDEVFRHSNQLPGGLSRWCRSCENAHRRQWSLESGRVQKANPRVELRGGQWFKECSWCGDFRSATEEYFYKKETGQLGLMAHCIECDNKRSLEYSRENREESVERSMRWNRENKARHRRHLQATKSKRRAAKGYHDADDRFRVFEESGGVCFYCETPLSDDHHIDHIVALANNGSNDPSNLVAACPACNRRKQAREPHEFCRSEGFDSATERLLKRGIPDPSD